MFQVQGRVKMKLSTQHTRLAVTHKYSPSHSTRSHTAPESAGGNATKARGKACKLRCEMGARESTAGQGHSLMLFDTSGPTPREERGTILKSCPHALARQRSIVPERPQSPKKYARTPSTSRRTRRLKRHRHGRPRRGPSSAMLALVQPSAPPGVAPGHRNSLAHTIEGQRMGIFDPRLFAINWKWRRMRVLHMQNTF